jgi:hypothetical protein
MPTPTQLGMNAKLFYKIGGVAGAGVYVELSNCRDVTMNNEKGEADVTTRANQGYRARAGTLKDISIEFEMLSIPADPNLEAIQEAYFLGTALGIRCLDQAGAGGQGIEADMEVFTFARSEPLEEGVTYSVSLKVARSDTPPAWYIAP